MKKLFKFRNNYATIASTAPVAIALFAQIILVISVILVARQGDRDLQRHQLATIDAFIGDAIRSERLGAADTGFWNALADSVATTPFRTEFLINRLAYNLVTYSNAEIAAIVDEAGTPVWVVEGQEPSDAAAYHAKCVTCDLLAADVFTRAADPTNGFGDYKLEGSFTDRAALGPLFPVLAEFTSIGDRPVIVTAAPIAREAPSERPARPTYALVSVIDFDVAYVSLMSKQLGIPDIAYFPAGTTDRGVAIHDSRTGKEIGRVAGPDVTPAQDLLIKLAPIGLAFMVVFTSLVLALMRWLRRVSIDRLAGEVLGNHMALHDPLTGLGNRAYLAVSLDAMLVDSASGRLSLVLIDLDGFKGVNDIHGHGVGDELIRQFAGRLARSVPDGAKTIRLGGDEFAVLLTGHDQKAAGAVGAIILQIARQPFHLDGIEARIGCSVGIAFAMETGQDRTDLLRRADIALYKAKGGGRNRVEFYDGSLDDGVRQRREMEESLRLALSRSDGFAIAFTPVYSLAGASPTEVGMEAGLRLRQPDGSLVSASELIRSAEELGLAVELGTAMLRMACRAALSRDHLTLTVNISPVDVSDPTFHDRVMMILDETGFPARRLELELNDGLQIAGSRAAIAALKRLRAAGIRLSLDNFGAGYANVGQLRNLPIHSFKISPTLLRGLEGASNAATILNAMVALGDSIGLTVSADGVESAFQLQFLKEAGCVRAQGPIFADPAPTPARKLLSAAA